MAMWRIARSHLYVGIIVLHVLKCFPLLLLLAISFAVRAQERTIFMQVGDVKVIDLADVERVAIGNESVVQYRPLENGQLLFTASEAGMTKIHVWQRGDRQTKFFVKVENVSIQSRFLAVKKVMRAFPQVTLEVVDGVIVASGNLDPRDIERFERVLQTYPNILSLVELLGFEERQMIRLDVKLIEVNQTATSSLGFNWQQVINGPVLGWHKAWDPNTTGGFYRVDPAIEGAVESFGSNILTTDTKFYSWGAYTGVFTSTINLLAQSGDAKILASPKLVASSGESASFLSGGEYPIPVRDDGELRVEFKEYGVKLDITPVINHQGLIDTAIFTEVSAIDFQTEVLDVPGLTTRRAETRINLKDGETLVISGLAYLEEGGNKTKVPGLGDIPFIGRLFQNRDKTRNQRELIISVTPRVVTVNGQHNQKLRNVSDRFIETFDTEKLQIELME